MKLTRKLIPAFAMLLIAAVMLTTASFAWFSMSTRVTANNMSVTATTPASLEISANNSDWAYSANATTPEGTKLNPVTLHTDGKWYVPTGDNVIGTDGRPSVELDPSKTTYWTEVGDICVNGKGDDTKTYALVNTFYLRTNSGASTAEADKIVFTAKATIDGESALENGVKVYIYYTEGGAKKVVEVTATGTANDTTWEAPLASSGESIALSVVIIYDGTVYDAINNSKADTKPTNVLVTFDIPAKIGA